MSIYEAVNAQLKDAMKAQDKVRLGALRGIRAAFIAALKEEKNAGQQALDDEQALAYLRGLAKQRKDSIESYRAGGRQDLVDAEQAELAVIESFLPQLADEATTRAWVQQAIAETGATSKKDMGKVMGALMKAHKAELDGNIAKKVVGDLLP